MNPFLNPNGTPYYPNPYLSALQQQSSQYIAQQEAYLRQVRHHLSSDHKTEPLRTLSSTCNKPTNDEHQQILQQLQEVSGKLSALLEKNGKENTRMDSVPIHAKYESLKSAMRKVLNYAEDPRPRFQLRENNNKIQKLQRLIAKQYSKYGLHLSSNAEDDQYMAVVKQFIKRNLNIPKESPLITTNTKQADAIEVYDINIHPRIPALNAQKGLRTKMQIKKNTVIGEYFGVYYLESDFEDIYNGTFIYNTINEYAFAENIYVDIPRKMVKQFTQSLFMDDNNDMNVTTPPCKKRKLSHNKAEKVEIVNQCFTIIIDGYSVPNESPLCFMNDCRKNIHLSRPTAEDHRYMNVKFIKVYHNGWPKILAITTKDVDEKMELCACFGGKFGDTTCTRKRFENGRKMMRNEMEDILREHGVKI